jgi:predicted GIY-YIG superfamily endonuclease
MATHAYWIYILTNRWNGTLYVGVTNNLKRRVWGARPGRYRVLANSMV